MKIIGKSKEGYLIEISENEMYRLIGHEYKTDCPDLDIGAKIKVSEMYERLNELKNNEGEINQIVRKLKDVIEALKPVAPMVDNVVNLAKEEEE